MLLFVEAFLPYAGLANALARAPYVHIHVHIGRYLLDYKTCRSPIRGPSQDCCPSHPCQPVLTSDEVSGVDRTKTIKCCNSCSRFMPLTSDQFFQMCKIEIVAKCT